jgi:hypothetical protein
MLLGWRLGSLTEGAVASGVSGNDCVRWASEKLRLRPTAWSIDKVEYRLDGTEWLVS